MAASKATLRAAPAAGLGNAGLRAGHHHDPPLVRIGQKRLRSIGRDDGLHAERHKYVRRAHRVVSAREFRRVHANDGHGRGVDVDGFADHAGRAGKAVGPVAIADHDDRPAARLSVVGFANGAAQSRLHAKCGVEVAGDHLRAHGFGAAIDGGGHAPETLDREDIPERMVLLSQLLIDGIGKRCRNGRAARAAVKVSPEAFDRDVVRLGAPQKTKLFRGGAPRGDRAAYAWPW